MPTRSQLADFTRGIVGRFISRNNDIGGLWGIGVLVEAIHEAGETEALYYLASSAEPWVRDQADWLRARVSVERIPEAWIESCILHVSVTRDVIPPAGSHTHEAWEAGTSIPEVVVRATIIDDREREWSASDTAWCWDASVHELQSTYRRADSGWLSRVFAAIKAASPPL